MISKSLISIKKEREKSFIQPSKNDTLHSEDFSFPLLAILAQWRQMYHNKDGKSIILNQQIIDSQNKGSIKKSMLLQRSFTPKGFSALNKGVVATSLFKKFGEAKNENLERSDSKDETPAKSDSKDGRNSFSNVKNKSDLSRSMSIIDEIDVPDEDEKIATDFLNRFLLNDENSAIAMINLVYFFKSIPKRMTKETFKRSKFFKFQLFQESLVAYMNIQDVNAFEYNDIKNRDRIAIVRNKLNDQKKNLSKEKEFLKTLESSIDHGALKLGKDMEKEIEFQIEEQNKLMMSAPNNF